MNELLEKAMKIRRDRDTREQAAATVKAIESQMSDLQTQTRLAIEEAVRSQSSNQLRALEEQQRQLLNQLAELITTLRDQSLEVNVPETKLTLDQQPVTVNVPELAVTVEQPAIELSPVFTPDVNVSIEDSRAKPKSITVNHSDGTQSQITFNY